MRKVAAVIQARMGSTRVPGKVMINLNGKPIIQHILEGLKKSYAFTDYILATTKDPRNDEMVDFAKNILKIKVYREEAEDDIAARLFNSSLESNQSDGIVKVNADCPIVDPKVINKIANTFVTSEADYVSNKIEWTYPKGLSCEALSNSSLKWCHENLNSNHDRELVCDYIKNNSSQFFQLAINSEDSLGHRNWMLDTPEELDILKVVFDEFHDKEFEYQSIESFLVQKYGVNYEW
ncbi:MAG: NTP transferase domain-containing protein [Oligoflexia bacterium]|nr:NTP transferase domain-containing protein [Oligoflexia bacterium]